jgi:hypothetical protein
VTQTVPIWVPIVTAIITSLGGFLLGRFTMSKKERADVEQKNYENSVNATASHDDAYREYIAALTAYGQSPTADGFVTLCRCGDTYFSQVGRMCDTILSGRVNEGMRDSTWLPAIKAAFDKSLPNHYEVLQSEAAKHGYTYKGKLRRRDHESIHAVAEKFSTSSAWLRPHEDD